jgi:hypothetical protein
VLSLRFLIPDSPLKFRHRGQDPTEDKVVICGLVSSVAHLGVEGKMELRLNDYGRGK